MWRGKQVGATDQKENTMNIQKELKETRKLFMLLDPLTKEKNLMTKIVRFHIEKNTAFAKIEDNLERVSNDCKMIIGSASEIMKKIQALSSTEKSNWNELENYHNEIDAFLRDVQKSLSQISERALLRNKDINSFFHMKKKKQADINQFIKRTATNDLFKGPTYEKLINILTESPTLDGTVVSAALTRLGNREYVRKIRAYFNHDYDEMYRFLEREIHR